MLGILKLREKFDKVLYIDVDLHHGDGKFLFIVSFFSSFCNKITSPHFM